MLHSLLDLVGKSDGDCLERDGHDKTADDGDSMVDILVRHNVDLTELYPNAEYTLLNSAKISSKPPGDVGANFRAPAKENSTKFPKQAETNKLKFGKDVKRKSKNKVPLVINRRRRRKRNDSDSSSEESDGEGTASSTSDRSLSLLTETLGEDDLEMLNSLSDSNSSCDENEAALTKETSFEQSGSHQSFHSSSKNTSPLDGSMSSTKQHRGGKRQIFLAATFNLAPSASPQATPATGLQTTTKKEVSDLEGMRLSDKNKDAHVGISVDNVPHLDPETGTLDSSNPAVAPDTLGISNLVQETNYQSVLHAVCCLLSNVSSLMSLRVFMEWLQSYPIVVATRSQVSNSDGWIDNGGHDYRVWGLF